MCLDELFMLLGVLGKNPLLRISVWNVLPFGVILHHLFAFETQTCFKGGWAIVEAGVNDLS